MLKKIVLDLETHPAFAKASAVAKAMADKSADLSVNQKLMEIEESYA